MHFIKVYITYKDSVLGPQGEAVKKAVHRMGYEAIEDIRIRKYFEMQLADAEGPIDTVIEAICDKLLANVNMGTCRYEIRKVEEV